MTDLSQDRFPVPNDVPEPPFDGDQGRPSGPLDEDGLRSGRAHQDAPTEAPEEQGGNPTTEHAPGADL